MSRSLAVIGCALLLWPVVVLCYHHWPAVPPGDSPEATSFVMPYDVWPEPAERFSYLAALVLSPALLVAQLLLANRIRRGVGVDNHPWLVRGAGIAVLALLGTVVWATLNPEGRQHFGYNVFVRRPVATLPLFLTVLAVIWYDRGTHRAVRWAANGIVAAAVVSICLLFFFSANHVYTWHTHLDAVLFSVVQVHLGKTLLVDAACQYGLYGQLLAPMFALVGLSVAWFTAVMAGLLACSYFLLWVSLRNITRRPSVAAVGLLALLFNNLAVFLVESCNDLYFQYLPLRLIAPAALVGLGAFYLQRPNRALGWSILAVLSVGVLWNLDSGVPALLTWLIVLSYGELSPPVGPACVRIAGHWVAGVSALAVVSGLYSVATRLTAGVWPNFGEAIAYQRAFYLSGFAMLPAPWPGLWMLVLIAYAAGLARAAAVRLNGTPGPRDSMILLLSVLGLGLFTYYQGRSHLQCLRLAAWPVFLLLALFLDGLLDRMRAGPGRVLELCLASALVWLLAGSAVSLATLSYPDGRPVVFQFAGHLRRVFAREQPSLAGVEHWIRGQVKPGETMVYLGRGEAYWHLRTGIAAPQQRGLMEMLFLKEFQRLTDRLEAGEPALIVVERGYLELLSHNRGYDLLRKRLHDRHYRVQSVYGELTAVRYTPDPGDTELPTVGEVRDAPGVTPPDAPAR
jgi:hypothetical protein